MNLELAIDFEYMKNLIWPCLNFEAKNQFQILDFSQKVSVNFCGIFTCKYEDLVAIGNEIASRWIAINQCFTSD